ncbi:MAG: TldD/PmbA family protein [Acidimicrobiales bacterium]
MPEAPELLRIADQLLGRARSGEEIEIYLSRTRHTEVSVVGGAVESFTWAEESGIGLRILGRGRQGFAYSGSLDPTGAAQAFEEARENCLYGSIDPYACLALPDGVEPADLDLGFDGPDEWTSNEKVDLALEVAALARAADRRVRTVESAGYGDSRSESAVVSTTGIRSGWHRASCSVYAHAIAGDDDDTHTGYGYCIARHPRDLDPKRAAIDAAERATRLLGATKPASAQMVAVLDPRVTASLLGVLAGALSAEAMQKERSMFVGAVGTAVAASVFSLLDDPTDTRSLGASRFDAEGLACRRNLLVDGGRLVGLLHNATTARRADTTSNACARRAGHTAIPGVGSRALSLASGTLDQAQLLASIDHGVLVLSAFGLGSGTNAATGDFSVGVEGQMIRNGVVAEPIREATIAARLGDLLANVEAVGSDVEWLPGGSAGVSLVVSGMTLSGT